MTVQKPSPESPSPAQADAEVFAFTAKRDAEELDPNDLTADDLISFFVQRWNHPAYRDTRLDELIAADLKPESVTADEWQECLQRAVDDSPLFDFYDELVAADNITRLLDATMRSTRSSHGALSTSRKAMSTLMYLRASEVIREVDRPLEPQVDRLPLGDEELWENLVRKLAKEA